MPIPIQTIFLNTAWQCWIVRVHSNLLNMNNRLRVPNYSIRLFSAIWFYTLALFIYCNWCLCGHRIYTHSILNFIAFDLLNERIDTLDIRPSRCGEFNRQHVQNCDYLRFIYHTEHGRAVLIGVFCLIASLTGDFHGPVVCYQLIPFIRLLAGVLCTTKKKRIVFANVLVSIDF